MTRTLIVIDDPADWAPYTPDDDVISADDYLFGQGHRAAAAGTRVINLCARYRYLSIGYYVSLLAEARRHRVVPSVRTLNDLARKAMYSLETGDLDERINAGRAAPPPAGSESRRLNVFFGRTADPADAVLGRQLFEAFPAPLLEVTLSHAGRWRISGLRTLALPQLTEAQQGLFADALDHFSRNVWRSRRARRRYRYDLAILHDPAEQLPPSNARALQHFVRVGRSLGIDAELITRRDYSRLAEYDALFIRETTALTNHTYRFAKRAEREGMVVMDDPDSILRCTNKVYLTDLLTTHRVSQPATRILHRGRRNDLDAAGRELGFPLVLKIPDGSFSRGVEKVATAAALGEAAAALFRRSDLILAQAFVASDFDWRIGMLDGRPLYACQYFFPRGHW